MTAKQYTVMSALAIVAGVAQSYFLLTLWLPLF
jgi:hypothetical protein